jgi:hypothetical protein
MKVHPKWAEVMGAGGAEGYMRSDFTRGRSNRQGFGKGQGQGKKLGHQKKLNAGQWKKLGLSRGLQKKKVL